MKRFAVSPVGLGLLLAMLSVVGAQEPAPERTSRLANVDTVVPGAELKERLWRAAIGDRIQFGLGPGISVVGWVRSLTRSEGGLSYIAGECVEPWSGRFFFQPQVASGAIGDWVGLLEFPELSRAYRLENSGLGQEVVFTPSLLGEVTCLDLPLPKGQPYIRGIGHAPKIPLGLDSGSSPSYQNGIISLQSQPGAIPVIYLDFQGGYTPTWGGITYARPEFANEQIREIWQRVSEDFSPFNINVTTDLQVFQTARQGSRQRAVITPTDTARPGFGGAAYFSSFNWSGDTPCWSFVISDPKSCAQACSHELGHTLGLAHDGQDIGGVHFEYYYGHGEGATGWGPIMGAAYDKNVTQWSKGDYLYANNPQDQLAIIVAQTGVEYRTDDVGQTLAASRYLEIYDDFTVSAQGIIERTAETDAFQFSTSGGMVELRAEPAADGPNLAMAVSIFDANDLLILSNCPQSTLGASLSTNLAAGTYTFRVTGAGRHDGLTNGFSNYGSLGWYSVTGSVANARLPDRFKVSENAPVGTWVGKIAPWPQNSDPRLYRITAGNNLQAFAIDDHGELTVSSSSALDYESLLRKRNSTQFELLVDIVNLADSTLSETNRRVVVTVTDVNEPPTLNKFITANSAFISPRNASMTCFLSNACQFSFSVTEHAPSGTAIGQVVGMDPDFGETISYTIVSGDPVGAFAIDAVSGLITLTGDLDASQQAEYLLEVVVSDQHLPLPLTATAKIDVMVQLPYTRGSLAVAAYTNIPGTEVFALTSASSFPQDPAWEEMVNGSETVVNEPNGFGAVFRGYLLPPYSGDYTFWIASQDDGELYLSSSTNPASMTRIAYINVPAAWPGAREWTKYPSQQSAPISLSAGKAYYLEARQKGSGRTNYLGVAWQCSHNLISRQIIQGEYLSPVSLNYVPHLASGSFFLHEDAFSGARFGYVAVQDLNVKDKHRFEILPGNQEEVFSIEPATGQLRLLDEGILRGTNAGPFFLDVKVSDDGVPPLSNTGRIEIKVVPKDFLSGSFIQQEVWTNLSVVTNLQGFVDFSRYPKRPDVLRSLADFEAHGAITSLQITNFLPDLGMTLTTISTWGSRTRAWVVPTNSGWYTFYLAATDEAQLWFSSRTNPSPLLIASRTNVVGFVFPGNWTVRAGQQSVPLYLEAGEPYYLEEINVFVDSFGPILFLQDFFQVGWSGPGLQGTNVIGRSFLRPYDIEYAPELTPRMFHVPVTITNGTVVGQLAAVDSPMDFLTYKWVSGNTGNTFALDPNNGVLTLADNTLLTARSIWNFNLVVQVQDSGYGGLYPLRTSECSFAVQVVDTEPALVWSGNGKDANWSTPGNWTEAVPQDQKKLTFLGKSNQTNHNDLLTRVAAVSLLNGGYQIDGNPLVLLEGLSSRGDNQWLVELSVPTLQSFVVSSGTLTLGGSISGSGGLKKSGLGTLMMNGVNSYAGPTIVSEGQLRILEPRACTSSSLIDLALGSSFDISSISNGYSIPLGQTLRGAGKVLGNVLALGMVEAATIQGVATSRLSFQGNLFLSGKTRIPIARTNFVSRPPIITSKVYTNGIQIGGKLEYGGTLSVTNVGGKFVLGDVFKLFEASTRTGAFTSVELPPLAPGLGWDTSGLLVDGSIKVGAGPVQIIPELLPDDRLALHVQTAVGLHYVLESTASLQPPIQWKSSTRTGTGEIMTLLVPLETGQTQRFYRMRIY